MAQKLGAIERVYVRRMTNRLVEKGKQIIENAANSKESGNISLNQLDAYGLIVYYNGRVQRSLVGSEINIIKSLYRSPEPYNISPNMAAKNKRFAAARSDGEIHRGWDGIPDGTGYEWARMFIKELGKTGEIPATGFALVVFNAAFYSNIQEHGGGTLRRTYKIISQVVGDLDNVARDYKDSTVRTYNL